MERVKACGLFALFFKCRSQLLWEWLFGQAYQDLKVGGMDPLDFFLEEGQPWLFFLGAQAKLCSFQAKNKFPEIF